MPDTDVANSSATRRRAPFTLVMVTTTALTLRTFFLNLLCHLKSRGVEVIIVSSEPEQLAALAEQAGVREYAVEMNRGISPASDLRAILKLARVLRCLNVDMVHSHTPKAGWIAMCASTLAGVKIRIYTFNGLVLLSACGFRRWVLRVVDRIACALATDVICVSESLRREVIGLGLCAPDKARVLGAGGSHGVDVKRFHPGAVSPKQCEVLRQRLGLPKNAVVLGFVGRLVADKGLAEVVKAWAMLRVEFPSLHLVVCGDFESCHPLAFGQEQALLSDCQVHVTKTLVADIVPYYSLMDVVMLPSYREGLPNVLLEAGAMEIPVVCTRVAGCIDIVADGVNGLIVEHHDHVGLALAVRSLVLDPGLRRSLGARARMEVVARFSEEIVLSNLCDEYQKLLDRKQTA